MVNTNPLHTMHAPTLHKGHIQQPDLVFLILYNVHYNAHTNHQGDQSAIPFVPKHQTESALRLFNGADTFCVEAAPVLSKVAIILNNREKTTRNKCSSFQYY